MCFFSPACLTALGKNEAVMVVLFAGLIKQGLLSRAVKIFEDLKEYINDGPAREDLFRRNWHLVHLPASASASGRAP